MGSFEIKNKADYNIRFNENGKNYNLISKLQKMTLNDESLIINQSAKISPDREINLQKLMKRNLKRKDIGKK